MTKWIVGLGLIFCAGCWCRGPVSIHSEDPDLKINALKQDAGENNKQDAATMVSDLRSDDPAIRFYSIQTLRRLTHDDFGYHYYETEERRAPAMKRWEQWLADQKLKSPA